MSRAIPRAAEDISVLRPVAPTRNLRHEIAERLAAEIVAGKLAPGDRLPTEQAMVTAMGVSRTVVREAVASLRAEGLVVTRQGAGAFVAADAARRPFRLAADGLLSLQEVLNVMELRTSVEVEAAGLAAERCTAAGRQRIARTFAAMERAIAQGESAVDEDFAFHFAIAAATGNPQFPRFLEYLGRFIIPRQSVRLTGRDERSQRAYLELILEEHRAIRDAVVGGDAAAARRAMRKHLLGSQRRYGALFPDVKDKRSNR
jgi:GntR family transcriptional regulator, transcriptional repressor for pyruvate dehydrogenase complex